MKILQAQSALLTNWEVHQVLQSEENEYSGADQSSRNRKKPPNLKALMTGTSFYFARPKHPFNTPGATYTPTSVAGPESLMARLSPKYRLTKAEYVMLLNLRPVTMTDLEMVVEEASQRFEERELWDMLDVIREVLGGLEGGG